MSKGSSSSLLRNGLLPGKARNTAVAFGGSLRYRLQASLNVLPIHFVPVFASASRSNQTQQANKSKRSSLPPVAPPPLADWRQRLRGKAGSFGRPLRVILSVALIFIISQAAGALVVGFIHGLLHNGHTIGQDLESSAWLQFIFILVAEGLAVWLVWRLLKGRRLKPAQIGLGRRPALADLRWAIGGFVVFYLLWLSLALVLTILMPDVNLDQTQDVGFTSLGSGFDWVLAFVALVLLPPLGEETLVRGYLFSGLRKSWTLPKALIVTSLLFGVAHVQTGNHGFLNVWGAAIDTFVLSVVLVYLRERTGALYACMFVHLLNNLLAFFVHFHA